jgi:hypothetical protein
MQDRYVGDVGDYAKYALLRLISSGNVRLGIIWCLYPDESHNADGRHTSYLRRPEYRNLDPELQDKLAILVRVGRRSVNEVRRARIFPLNTVHFCGPVVQDGVGGKDRRARVLHREQWLTEALEATVDCDVVFFDPDNGLEVPSVPKWHPKAGKYVFLDELTCFWRRGQSIVLYHHLNRLASVADQTKALTNRLSASFSNAALITSLLFRRGSCRHFWILAQRKDVEALKGAVERILNSGWRCHFEVA